MTLKQKLRGLLEQQGRGAKSRLSERLDIPLSYVSRYASDDYTETNLPARYFKKAADFFGVDVEYFFEDNFVGAKPVKKVPIIATASCGQADTSSYQGEGEFTYYNGDHWTNRLYCVIACGDSMSPEIEDGDEVVCDPDAEIQNGNMVHYKIHGESAIKIYFKDEDVGIISFIPYNQSENFKTRSIRIDEDVEYRVAKVVAINKLKLNNNLARLKMVGRA